MNGSDAPALVSTSRPARKGSGAASFGAIEARRAGETAAMLSLKLSRRLAVELMPDFDVRHLGISQPDDPALIMLAAYCRQLQAMPPDVPAPVADLFTRQIKELIASVLNSSPSILRNAQFGGVRATRLQSVLHAIRANLRDPGLSAASVGKTLGLSGRYVQMLLDGAGMSFSVHVRDLRLEEARRMLTAQRSDHLRITDIAYMVGFNDLSYFNREFRKKYGATPRDMRQVA
jgi:AraC-like DNA-binding protein